MTRTRIAALILAAATAGLPAAAQTGQTGGQAGQILDMTRANWVALRDWDGQDLIYFTHLESYRCGIASVAYSVNGGKLTDWALAPCETEGALFAPLPADHLPYVALPGGSVDKVTVQITYPDGSRAMAAFERAAILMP